MREFDTITITQQGQAQLPARWRKQAGLLQGGLCDVRVVNDGRQSLLITPRDQKRRGAVGLLAHLKSQTIAFPVVERHTMSVEGSSLFSVESDISVFLRPTGRKAPGVSPR